MSYNPYNQRPQMTCLPTGPVGNPPRMPPGRTPQNPYTTQTTSYGSSQNYGQSYGAPSNFGYPGGY